MKPSIRMCASRASSGRQKPPMSAMRTGFVWRLSCDPGQLLDQLLERADPARQGDESVGAIEHRLLAFVHVLDDHHLLDGGQRDVPCG